MRYQKRAALNSRQLVWTWLCWTSTDEQLLESELPTPEDLAVEENQSTLDERLISVSELEFRFCS